MDGTRWCLGVVASLFIVSNAMARNTEVSAAGQRLVCSPECRWEGAATAPAAASMQRAEQNAAPFNVAPVPAAAAASVASVRTAAKSTLTSSAVSSSEAGLDLFRVVKMAVETYPSIRDAAATVDEQRTAVDVARAGYYPSVQVGANTGHQGQYGNGQALTLSASQMLYDFGKVSGSVNAAEASVRTRQLQLRAETEEVARQAALSAVDLHRYRALEDSARQQLDAVRQLAELARKRASAGASTQADLAQAETRVSAAEAALLTASAQVEAQKSRLTTMIGRSIPDGGVALPYEVLSSAAAAIHPDAALTTGVLIARSQRDEAQAGFEFAKANTKPTFTLDAGVSKYLGHAGDLAAGNVYTVTLGVKHNLLGGGAPSARVRGASKAVVAAEEQIHTRELEARDQWQVLQTQIVSQSSRIGVLEERQRSLADTQKLYREQYLSLGTRTLLDLLNSESERFQADSDRINAQHDLIAAQVGFINTTGHMYDVFGMTAPTEIMK